MGASEGEGPLGVVPIGAIVGLSVGDIRTDWITITLPSEAEMV
jgi:hypothetical protein